MFGKIPTSLTKPLGLGAQLTSSTYGMAIPTILGLTRIAPILIWAANVRMITGVDSVTGKTDWGENADFLLGTNPIYKILQLWSGGIGGGAGPGQYGLTGSAGVVSGGWPQIYSAAITEFGATTVVVPDPHLYYVLGVTLELTAGYNINFNDYGAPGPVNLTGTMESLLWNTAYAGSNPTTQGAFQFWPWVYTWVPADGTTIHIPQNAFGFPWTGGTIRIYYVSLPANFYREPISWYGLSFETQLGEGDEYATPQDNSAQQIIYPHLAGMGSPQLDLGSSGSLPQLLPEVIAGPTVWPIGDCDFVDMISDVFRSGITQTGSTATQGFSKVQKGLNAYNYPAYIQKKFIRSSFSDGNNLYFDLPNTAGNFLICAAVGVTPSTSTISDSAGNVWTQAFTNLVGGIAGFSLWYCASAKAWPARNVVTITNMGLGPTGQFIGEAAGVDTLDIVANGYQFSSSTPRVSSVTAPTTGPPGTPELLLGFLFSGTGLNSLLLDAGWNDEIHGTEGDVGFGVASRVVESTSIAPVGSPSVSAFSVVQTATYGALTSPSGTTATAIFANPVSVGNSFLVVIWSYLNSAYSGPSDNQGNTYTLVTSVTSGSLIGYLYLVTPTIAGATTITVTVTASTLGTLSISASEVTGLLSSPLDTSATNNNAGYVTSLNTGDVTTATANEVIFSTLQCAGGTAHPFPGDASVPSGYTSVSEIDIAVPLGYTDQAACAYRTVTSRGTFSPTWTNPNQFIGRGITAAFKIVAPSPAPQTGLYTFHTRFTSGDPNTWSTIIALKNSQAPPYPFPFGDILDQPSLDVSRAQGRAAGLHGSIVMDSQQKASDWLTQFGQAGNLAFVWSGFKLKCIPWSEVSAVGNGSIYTAPTASGPVADLSPADMIGDSSGAVITVERTAQIDVPNLMQVQYIDRFSQYDETLASEPETGAMALYGVRKDSPVVMRCIQDGTVARMILSIMIRRRNYIRDTYKFKLQAKWKLLEPMDLVTISDPLIGIVKIPVRLTSIEEDEEFNLDCQAEPFIYGTHNPLPLTVTDANPFTFNSNAAASQINTPIIFEAVPELGTISGDGELWIVLSSPGPDYGGSFIWVSTDGGVSYGSSPIANAVGNATTGYTVGDQPANADPDATNDLAVDLTESNGILASYTVGEEDAFAYPAYVEPGLGGAVTIPRGTLAVIQSASSYFSTNNEGYVGNPPGPASVGVHLNVTAGNTILIAVDAIQGESFTGPITAGDNSGINIYNLITKISGDGNHTTYIFGAVNNVTATLSIGAACVNGKNFHVAVVEVSGLGVPTVDFAVTASTNAASVVAPSIGTYTPSQAVELLVAIGGYQGTNPGVTQGFTSGGFTYIDGNSTQDPIIPGIFEPIGDGAVAIGTKITASIAPQSVTYATDDSSPSGINAIMIGLIPGPPVVIKTPPGQCLIPYELETYAIANLTATSMYTLKATGGGTNHLRRAVYSAPQPGLGVNHPNHSRFAFLGNPIVPAPPGIVKLRIQPSWYHETLYFKFVPYNTLLGGSPPLSSVTAYAFTPCGPSFPPPVTGATIVEVPLTPGAGGNFTVAHGLAAAPARVDIEMTSGGEIWKQSPTEYDGTNLYLTASAGGVTGIAICFIAPATYSSIVPFTTSAPGNFSVAHGLGSTPVLAIPEYINGGAVWSQGTPYDATNINLVASAGGVSGYLIVWSAWPTESIIRSPSLIPVVSTAITEITIAPGAPGNFTVAHGLGRTPVEAIIRDTSTGKIWWQPSPRFDATNLYLEASAAGITATVEIWY